MHVYPVLKISLHILIILFALNYNFKKIRNVTMFEKSFLNNCRIKEPYINIFNYIKLINGGIIKYTDYIELYFKHF